MSPPSPPPPPAGLEQAPPAAAAAAAAEQPPPQAAPENGREVTARHKGEAAKDPSKSRDDEDADDDDDETMSSGSSEDDGPAPAPAEGAAAAVKGGTPAAVVQKSIEWLQPEDETRGPEERDEEMRDISTQMKRLDHNVRLDELRVSEYRLTFSDDRVTLVGRQAKLLAEVILTVDDADGATAPGSTAHAAWAEVQRLLGTRSLGGAASMAGQLISCALGWQCCLRTRPNVLSELAAGFFTLTDYGVVARNGVCVQLSILHKRGAAVGCTPRALRIFIKPGFDFSAAVEAAVRRGAERRAAASLRRLQLAAHVAAARADPAAAAALYRALEIDPTAAAAEQRAALALALANAGEGEGGGVGRRGGRARRAGGGGEGAVVAAAAEQQGSPSQRRRGRVEAREEEQEEEEEEDAAPAEARQETQHERIEEHTASPARSCGGHLRAKKRVATPVVAAATVAGAEAAAVAAVRSSGGGSSTDTVGAHCAADAAAAAPAGATGAVVTAAADAPDANARSSPLPPRPLANWPAAEACLPPTAHSVRTFYGAELAYVKEAMAPLQHGVVGHFGARVESSGGSERAPRLLLDLPPARGAAPVDGLPLPPPPLASLLDLAQYCLHAGRLLCEVGGFDAMNANRDIFMAEPRLLGLHLGDIFTSVTVRELRTGGADAVAEVAAAVDDVAPGTTTLTVFLLLSSDGGGNGATPTFVLELPEARSTPIKHGMVVVSHSPRGRPPYSVTSGGTDGQGAPPPSLLEVCFYASESVRMHVAAAGRSSVRDALARALREKI